LNERNDFADNTAIQSNTNEGQCADMLTNPERLLISGAVDGELTRAEREEFLNLVATRPEARTLFVQLQSDAARLRALPVSRAPKRIAQNVLAHISTLPTPAAPVRRTVKRKSNVWLPYAVAASVLFAVTIGSFSYFNTQDEQKRSDQIARLMPTHQPLPHHRDTPTEADYVSAKPIAPSPNIHTIPPIEILPVPRNGEVLAQAPSTPNLLEIAPSPRPAGGEVVGFGIIENAKPLTEIDLRLPFTTNASDFHTIESQERLAKELALDPAYRLDLFTKDPPAGIKTLTAALKGVGIPLVVDVTTQERINKKMAVSLAIYIEGLTPAEIAKMLETVGKAVENSKVPPLDRANLVPAGMHDQKDLKQLFGVELNLQREAESTNTVGKSIAKETIGQIVSSLKKTVEKQAILLTYLPPNFRSSPMFSKEVKAFLDRRPERKSGTTPLLIVLRPAQ